MSEEHKSNDHKHDHKSHEHKPHAHSHRKKDNSTLIWQVISGILFVVLLFVIFNPMSTGSSGEVINELANQQQDVNELTGSDKQIQLDAELAEIPEEGIYGEDVPVIVYEFSDFECPYCSVAAGVENSLFQQFKQRDPSYEAAIPKIKEVYGDKVRVIYKHLPLSFHANANNAALASECAREQGKFWAYHDVLFENQQALTKPDLVSYAKDLELEMDQFNSCLDEAKYQDKIDADVAMAQSLGISGTPGFLVEDQVLSGAQGFSSFEAIIESYLGKEKKVRNIEDDPEFEIKVLTKEDCIVCDTQTFEDNIVLSFPKASVVKVDVNSEEGKDLVAKFGLSKVPQFIFDKEVENTKNYIQLRQALTLADDVYVLDVDGAGLPTQLIEAIDISEYPTLGDENAPITIVEFSEFECPYCGASAGTHDQLISQFKQQDPTYKPAIEGIKENLIESGKAKLVFADFPLNFHQNAQKASEAAQCARDQEKFWEYHDVLFENQQALTVSDLKSYAADLELDQEAFDECLDSGAKADYVNNAYQTGVSLGVTGTPGFFINGIQLSGAISYAQLEQIIEQLN